MFLTVTKKLTAAVPIAAAALLAGGCASKGAPPLEQMATARASINQAEGARAREFAPVELLAAREKLAEAESATQRKEFGAARALAEKAEADASLAEAKARAVSAQNTVQDLQRSIATLRQEIERRAK